MPSTQHVGSLVMLDLVTVFSDTYPASLEGTAIPTVTLIIQCVVVHAVALLLMRLRKPPHSTELQAVLSTGVGADW